MDKSDTGPTVDTGMHTAETERFGWQASGLAHLALSHRPKGTDANSAITVVRSAGCFISEAEHCRSIDTSNTHTQEHDRPYDSRPFAWLGVVASRLFIASCVH